MPDKPPQSLKEVFRILSNIEEDILKTVELRTQSGDTLYDATLLIWGAANRTVAQCSGFSNLLRNKNFTCSCVILRMQLDTVLRLYGGLLYGNIAEYADKILNGERISNLKSTKGKRLFDSMLVKELAKQGPWISKVYDDCSGSIHLSRRHVHLAMSEIQNDGKIILNVGPSDEHLDEKAFLELGIAFLHTTAMVSQMISEWYKRIPVKAASS